MDYNAHIGGVDLGDQHRKYYQVRMKSRKFYKYIFWFLLRYPSLFTLSYLDYRVALAQELIGD